MSKEKVNSVLEVSYLAVVTEATNAMVEVFNSAEVEVGKDFIEVIKGKVYDALIMKVE